MLYSITDIHGHIYSLSNLILEILSKDKNPSFVFHGDYIDRGKHSKEVIDFLINLSSQYKCHFLVGNHDDVFNSLLKNNNYFYNKSNYVADTTNRGIINWFFQHGLIQTLLSYGISIDEFPKDYSLIEYDKFYNKINEVIPQNHKDFFNNLLPFYESDKYFSFHAYYPVNKELPRDLKFVKKNEYEEYIWGRFSHSDLLYSSNKWDKIGIFGHTPVSNYGFSNDNFPILKNNILLLDTGICFNGKLTSFCHETKEVIQINYDNRDILKI